MSSAEKPEEIAQVEEAESPLADAGNRDMNSEEKKPEVSEKVEQTIEKEESPLNNAENCQSDVKEDSSADSAVEMMNGVEEDGEQAEKDEQVGEPKALAEYTPHEMMSTCGRPVEIRLVNKKVQRGNVHSIHPYELLVTLVEFDAAEQKPKMMWMIPHCNIVSLRLLKKEEVAELNEVLDPSPELALWMSTLFGPTVPPTPSLRET